MVSKYILSKLFSKSMTFTASCPTLR